MVATRRRPYDPTEENSMQRIQGLQELSESIDKGINKRIASKNIYFHKLEAQQQCALKAKKLAEQRQGFLRGISDKIDHLKNSTYLKEWVLDAAEICSWFVTSGLFGLWYVGVNVLTTLVRANANDDETMPNDNE